MAAKSPTYRVTLLKDKKLVGWTLQRHALTGSSGYLGELLVSVVTANKIARALNTYPQRKA